MAHHYRRFPQLVEYCDWIDEKHTLLDMHAFGISKMLWWNDFCWADMTVIFNPVHQIIFCTCLCWHKLKHNQNIWGMKYCMNCVNGWDLTGNCCPC
jgi:hypothetical protein